MVLQCVGTELLCMGGQKEGDRLVRVIRFESTKNENKVK